MPTMINITEQASLMTRNHKPSSSLCKAFRRPTHYIPLCLKTPVEYLPKFKNNYFLVKQELFTHAVQLFVQDYLLIKVKQKLWWS